MGAILLALFIAGVAAYRMVQEHPAAATVAPEAPPAPVPPRGPDPRFSDGPPIPPPPPAVSRKPARKAAPAAAAPVEIEQVVTPPPSEPEHLEAPLETAHQPEPVQEKVIEPPAPVAPIAKPEARPKRWARAVGRFLHVVH